VQQLGALYFEGYRQPHYQEEDPFHIYRLQRDDTGLQEISRGRGPSLGYASRMQPPGD